MAAQVEVQTGEVGRPVAGGRLHLSPLTDSSNKSTEIPHVNQSHIITPEPNKPATGPKPRLTPKPFVVEKNLTIKPILAPKPQPKPRPESTRVVGSKPEPPSSPKPQQPVPPGKPKPMSTNPNRPAPTTFKASNKLNTGQTTKPAFQPLKPAPPFGPEELSKPTPPLPVERKNTGPKSLGYSKSLKKFPVSEWPGSTKNDDKGQGTLSKAVASITRAKSMGSLNQLCQEVEEEKEPKADTTVALRPQPRTSRPRPVSAIFLDNPYKTETPVPAPRWGGRRPLSTDLTSKFESIGLSLHRKTPNANTKENTPEVKALPQTRKTPKNVPPQSPNYANSPTFSDQSETNAEEKNVKETENENKPGSSIKSRISLLLDLSSSPAAGATGQGSDLNSGVQVVPETESPVGVKQLIKQLTEDATPTQSPIMKPALKPRPLPLDLTKRFLNERSPDHGSSFLSEATDLHEISKDPERRTEMSAASDQWIVDLTDTPEQLQKDPTPKESEAFEAFSVTSEESRTASELLTVRASMFENVVERHSVVVVEEGKPVNNNLLRKQSFKKESGEDKGTLVTATYKEPIAPSSPLRVVHAFDTVQAVEENRAVSEHIPTAQWEDKAMTLRPRRSEGSRVATEISNSANRDPAFTATPEHHPRYLRVGALQKWTTADFDKDAGISKITQKESKREVAFDMDRDKQEEAEQEELAGEPKRLKRQAEEQPKPKATYFALTAQIQEPVSPVESGENKRNMTSLFDDFSVGSLLASSQGKILSVRRNPSLDEAFGKAFKSQDQVEESAMRMHMTHKEIRSVSDGQTIEEIMEVEKTREAKMKERLALEEQAQFARMKEREMQREFERQRQIAFEKEKQEIEEREQKRQKQIELEKQRLERERRREEERQRELDREKHLMDIQKEKQKREDVEKFKELERQKLLEFENLKKKEKERQQALELEQHRQREKMEREEAEKMKQVALEQEMLRLKELDRERERKWEMEKESQKKLEWEKQKALERQREKDLEREREREKDLERERQRQLDIERQELENQRLRKQELEKELFQYEAFKEMERKKLLEMEKQKQAEMERQQTLELEKRRLKEKMEMEEAEKMRQIAKQHEAERKRLKDKQKKEEQEKARSESSPLRPKMVDLEQYDPLYQFASQRSDPATRWKEPSPKAQEFYKPAILDIDSFTSQTQLPPYKDLLPVSNIQGVDTGFGNNTQPTPERDISWKTSVGFSNPVWTSPQDPWEMCSDEMSVDQPMAKPKKHENKTSPDQLLLRQEEQQSATQRHRSIGLDDLDLFDPFSPTKIGSPPVAGVSSSVPAEMIWLPREPQRQDRRAEIKKHSRSQGSQELNRMRSRSVSRRSAPSSTAFEGNLPRTRSRSAHREADLKNWVQEKQSVRDDKEVNDSETPGHDTDSQYGTWETGLRTDDSLTPATPSSESNLSTSPRKPTPLQTPGEHDLRSETDTLDSLLPSSQNQLLSFPDAPTTLLDTSVLRSRAQLGKKRPPRTRPSRAARQSTVLTEGEGKPQDDWLYRDSTDAKVEIKDDDSDSEEQNKEPDVSPAVVSQPQRVALFPGMDPSALKAQLKKRGDSDSQIDGPSPSSSQLSRSPKSPFLPQAARVLPTPGGKDNGEENSPQWLKELKSKKRLSQYESES